MQNVTNSRKARGFDVWLHVGRTNLKVHRVLNQLLSTLELSLAQHEILMTIGQHRDLTQRQLSEKLLVVKSNVSALLKKLEARGLVSRALDSKDSRNKRLKLTVAGERLVEKSFELQNRVVDAMASQLSDDDLKQLDDVMGRVSNALDQLAADGD